MAHVTGLRSPYAKVGRLVHFGRMLDKIRLHARGALPGDYHANLGKGFDGRTCRFLGVRYEDLRERVKAGGGDEEVLEWAQARGTPRSERHPYAGVWNGTFTLREPVPVVMVFDLADSTKGAYAGFTVLPNGARAPHLETTVTKGEVRWKQTNSGGGFWVYTGQLVGRDSVAGKVVLTDWPQLPAGEKPPTGTFSLVRRTPGA